VLFPFRRGLLDPPGIIQTAAARAVTTSLFIIIVV
jgi:hypothetical protein